MNRVDFMNQLERLLQSIAPGEREEALQYYNDYFDDAGKENEQEVIEALGNPARVAENIKRDLLGNGYGGGPAPKAQASDRALVEYGKETEEESVSDGSLEGGKDGGKATSEEAYDPGFFQEKASGGQGAAGEGRKEQPASSPGSEGAEETHGGGAFRETAYGEGGFGASAGGRKDLKGQDLHQRSPYQQNGYEAPVEKEGMPLWAVALLITLLVFASPVVLGILCVIFALIIVWYTFLVCMGVVAVALFIVMVVLVVTGILSCFVNPWVGLSLLGGGLVCGGIGIIFLMITVAMGGIVTPAIWRGLGLLFRRKRKGVR